MHIFLIVYLILFHDIDTAGVHRRVSHISLYAYFFLPFPHLYAFILGVMEE